MLILIYFIIILLLIRKMQFKVINILILKHVDSPKPNIFGKS